MSTFINFGQSSQHLLLHAQPHKISKYRDINLKFARNLVLLVLLLIGKLLGVGFKRLAKIIEYVEVCFVEDRLYEIPKILMSQEAIHKAKGFNKFTTRICIL